LHDGNDQEGERGDRRSPRSRGEGDRSNQPGPGAPHLKLHARFDPLEQNPALLVISDVGPWDRHETVTDDVAFVVANLAHVGELPAGRRLLYYDSREEFREILHDGAGKFLGFAPGRRRRA
jgi:hypothetical protein